MKRKLLIIFSLLCATFLTLFVFNACGDERREPPHVHEYSTGKFDAENHWNECSCGAKEGVIAHSFDNNVCSCGYEKAVEHIHEYTNLKYGVLTHWYECACGEKSGVEDHKGGTATDTNKAVCSVCNQEYGSTLGHEHDFSMQTITSEYLKTPATCESKAEYYYSCACGMKTDTYFEYGSKLGHAYGDAIPNYDGTHSKICSNDLSHVITEDCHYVNDVCEICNDTKQIEGLKYKLINNDTEYEVVGIGNCKDLQIVIPNTYEGKKVTSIGQKAFYMKTSFISITIPETITQIGKDAFFGCYRLVEVYNKSNLDIVKGNSTFGYVGAYALNVYNEENGSKIFKVGDYYLCSVSAVNYLVAYDGMNTNLILPDETNIIYRDAFIDQKKISSVVMGDNVTEIQSEAFNGCKLLSNVVLSKNLTNIGSYAFTGCVSLSNIEIPSSVTRIGDNAFFGCYMLIEVYNKSNLNIVIGATGNGSVAYYALSVYTQPYESKLSTIGDYLIYTDKEEKILVGYLGTDKVLTVPNGITQINKYSFFGWDLLESISLPSTVTKIGDYAFWGCMSLENLSLGENSQLTSVGTYAFYYCSELKSISFANVSQIGSYAFSNCLDLESVTFGINSQLESVEDYTFYDCISLTNISLSNNIKNIGAFAFHNTNIKTIFIPQSVESIGEGAFEECGSLESVTFDANCELEIIGDSAFKKCSALIEIVIPDKVTNIGRNAFYNCTSLTNLTIGKGVKNIGNGAFELCVALTYINFRAVNYNENDELISKHLFNSAGINGDGIKIVFDSGVEYISSYLFSCSSFVPALKLKEVTIANTVKTIGYRVFEDCEKPIKINYLGSADSWAEIDFKGSLIIDGLQLYINGALATDVTLTTATKISDYAFANLSTLNSIEISESVKSIGKMAFLNCESLENVVVPNSVELICHGAFEGCDSLQSISLPFIGESSSSTDNGYFGYIFGMIDSVNNASFIPANLKTIKITGEIDFVADRAFNCLTKVVTIELPDTITKIGSYVFVDCSSLENLILPNNLKEIGINNLYQFNNLKSNVKDGVKYLGSHDNDYMYLLSLVSEDITEVSIDSNCKFIGGYSLVHSKIASLEIPSSVIQIDATAFASCENLTNIQVHSDNAIYKSIDGNIYSKDGTVFVYYACGKSGTAFNIPNNVTTIAKYAFSHSSIKEITIPSWVKTIESNAFEYSSLENITIEKGVTYIGSQVLLCTYSLENIIYKGSVSDWVNVTLENGWKTETGAEYVTCDDGLIYI